MSKVPADYVKRGLWVNVNDGPVMGRVITTDTQTGNIVIAILAVMGTIGTTHLWNLVSFSFHQFRSQSALTDGLYHQQQALLRTLPTPSSFLTDWIKIGWAWRKRTDKALLRSLPYTLLGIIFTFMAIVVGIFSSYVVSSNNIPVLIESPFCGWPTSPITANTSFGFVDPERKIISAARAYSRECYRWSTNSTQPESCTAFLQSRIHFTRERVECPINSTFCAKIDRPAVLMDSGLVDVNDGLGMNLPAGNKIEFRKRSQCALIDLKDRWSFVNVSLDQFNRELVPGERVYGLHLGNLTHEGQEHVSYIQTEMAAKLYRGFGVQYAQRYNSSLLSGLNTYIPLPGLEKERGDSFHITISKNWVFYESPVNDPLFSAHVPSKILKVNTAVPGYTSDFPLSSVWCHLQYQFCVRREDKTTFCTELDGLPGEVTTDTFPGTTELQRTVLTHLVQTSLVYDVTLVSQGLIVAEQLGQSAALPGVPDDQWVQEIVAWESSSWASLQTTMAERALGLRDLPPNRSASWLARMTTGDKEMCSKQRMRNPGGFVNINVFGLAFMITICSVITLIDIVLLKFLIYLQRFRKALAPRINSWIQDGVYQVQRRAFESQGQGQWEGLDQEVPTTVEMTKLTVSLDSVPLPSTQGGLGNDGKKYHHVVTTEMSTITTIPSTSTSTSTPAPSNQSSPTTAVDPNSSGRLDSVSAPMPITPTISQPDASLVEESPSPGTVSPTTQTRTSDDQTNNRPV